ncbi:IS110 family transposase [Streptomyces sp. BA2]|uniref:IS110 family transposase n=1 Tax=Streptomyces sp. BA2 TaxID=436595 RepID=UPI003FA723DB
MAASIVSCPAQPSRLPSEPRPSRRLLPETNSGGDRVSSRAAGDWATGVRHQPLAVALFRDRHSVAHKESAAIDAPALANILRTDKAAHRPLPADSRLAQAADRLTRAQQDAVWDRAQAHNTLRSQQGSSPPRSWPPSPSTAAGCAHARPRPPGRCTGADPGAKLTPPATGTAQRAGRQLGIKAEADQFHELLRRDYLHQLPGRGGTRPASYRPPSAARDRQHPDTSITTGFAGLGP